MKTHTTRLYQWATEKASSTKAPLWIGTLFALELFVFIPLDAILMFFCLQNPRKSFLYILIASAVSALSGLVGYLLGYFLWDLISSYVVPSLISSELFERVSGHFEMYESWAVFFGAFFPFPIKVLSLAGGVFHLGVLPFFCYLLMGRLLRFSLVGGAMVIWGDRLKALLDRHFHRLMLLVGAKIAAAFLFFWALAR